ncbi:MAG: phenylalanine--tRNA ligase subunit beta [Candidatus Nealsonbacteria bacterium]|nr:phenylalanine--tRNA ligase subunit beta [Candidatus Nealsonbacteria bacterium]
MIVSWNWLKQYVPLDMPLEELERRLMMSGLNHEGTEEVGGDLAVDLEVTSNRPDCLGHIGVAREVAVLWGSELTIPAAEPAEGKTPVDELVKVRIDCPDLCRRYTARVVRGVKIGPSPRWMQRRLETLGLTPINNVVDISNYVLMECGQPLHTFDFGKLTGAEIIVRRPHPGETIEAIDHHTYKLSADMCMIADARDSVAIGGVMGGAQTEISAGTADVLIEGAEFAPLSIRNTSRALNLHSDSSYRFERRIDSENIDWASRRCCELILELAGGELAAGVVDVGEPIAEREPIVLRHPQVQRVLGIDVPVERVREILVALGSDETESAAKTVTVVPPSWRGDLTREIDLIEEVARIHGYDQIPEDVGVPMVASVRTKEDRVVAKVRHALTAMGFDEAITSSVVDARAAEATSPWTDAEPLQSRTAVLRGADRLRTSLVPSLLAVRRTNEALANADIELFEIAKVYLPRGKKLPDEQLMLCITSGRDYRSVKGAIEAIIDVLNRQAEVTALPFDGDLLDPGESCGMQLGAVTSSDTETFGYVGQVAEGGLEQFDLRSATTVAEVKLLPLVAAAELIPQHVGQPSYPAVTRDLNLVVDDAIRYADVAATVRQQCGDYFEDLQYLDTYRDAERLGPDRKSLLLTIVLRSAQGTMTNRQADEIRDRIVSACGERHGAELR